MTSTLVLRNKSVQSREISGKEEFVRFCDLKKRVGVQQAKAIREAKRKLQTTMVPGGTPYIMPHPDVDSEEKSG